MTKKLIRELNCGNTDNVGQFRAKVYFDSDFEEYSVRFYRHTEYLGNDADYYADSKLDAINTAKQCLYTLELNKDKPAPNESPDYDVNQTPKA